MYTAIYCVAIVLFVGVLLFAFLCKEKKRKQKSAKMQLGLSQTENLNTERSETLSNDEKITSKEEILKTESAQENEKNENSGSVDAVMEDFSLDGEKKESANKKFATVGKNFQKNIFDFEENFSKDFDIFDDDNGIDDDEIAKYEQTLRESLKFDIDDEFDKFQKKQEEGLFASDPFFAKNDFQNMPDFDFCKFKGKSQSEVLEMIKNFPPKAQEIILTDILNRKNWED